MKTLSCFTFKPERLFMGPLPHGRDLIASIEKICRELSIQTAAFSVIGAVSSFTIGTYDQTQQVYVTAAAEAPSEIVACTGSVSPMDGNLFVNAHIALSDIHGRITGGHLFSETIIFAGEIRLQEFAGQPPERSYDQTTGLALWKY